MNNFLKYPTGTSGSMELDYDNIIVSILMDPNKKYIVFNIPYENSNGANGIFKEGIIVYKNNIDILILPKLSLESEIIIPSIWEGRMKYVIYENEEQLDEYLINDEILIQNAIDPTEISGDGDYALINDILYHRRMAV